MLVPPLLVRSRGHSRVVFFSSEARSVSSTDCNHTQIVWTTDKCTEADAGRGGSLNKHFRPNLPLCKTAKLHGNKISPAFTLANQARPGHLQPSTRRHKVEPVDGGKVILYAAHTAEAVIPHKKIHRLDWLPLPRMFSEAVGPVCLHSSRRNRALYAPVRTRSEEPMMRNILVMLKSSRQGTPQIELSLVIFLTSPQNEGVLGQQ